MEGIVFGKLVSRKSVLGCDFKDMRTMQLPFIGRLFYKSVLHSFKSSL